MSVYFIERPSDGAIKIGFAKDPFVRLRALAKALGQPLTFRRIADGGRKEEQEYHERFAGHCVGGEWFAPHKELEAVMASLALAPVNRRGMVRAQRGQRPPLSDIVEAFQQKYDVENRVMAAEIGLAPSTMTRIKQGKMPDAHGLAKIIAWMMKRPTEGAPRAIASKFGVKASTVYAYTKD